MLEFLDMPSYICGMNRRSFIQSLAAVFSLPALPLTSLRPVAAGIPAAADVPARVKSWAVYMANLHGDCTPLTLHRLLHIPETDAAQYVSRLVADGVLKSNPAMHEAARNLARPLEDNLLDERLEMTAQAEPEGAETSQNSRAPEGPDVEANPTGEPAEPDDASLITGQPEASLQELASPQYPSSSPLIT